MKQNERALLQERVRTLVLKHALETTLARILDIAGPEVAEELLKLEHRIVAAARNLGSAQSEVALATMVAVEDAVTTIRTAFDTVHERLEAAAPAKAPALAA